MPCGIYQYLVKQIVNNTVVEVWEWISNFIPRMLVLKLIRVS